ncbi:MAG TPA: FHA domain-containing protein [Kofleriaceae bacterium]|nr:FHA domain-containing protein [Kofleriaceae bacterium]
MTVCNRCGKENQDHYKFCLGCGAELVAKPAGGDVGMMKTMMAEPGQQSPMAGAPLRGTGGPMAPPQPPLRSTAGGPAGMPGMPPAGPLGGGSMGGPMGGPAMPPPMAPQPMGPPPGVPGFSPGFAPPAATQMRRCPSCGSDVPPSFRFCGTCGFRMDEVSAPNMMPPQPAMGAPQPMTMPQRSRLSMTLIRPDGTEGGTHDLRPGENKLGRSFGPVFENDGYLSPVHAQLDIRGQNAVVRDLDSLNGVFVKMTQEEELQSGQIIRIGQELLRFELIPAPEPTADGTELMGSPNPGYWGKLTVIIGREVTGQAFPLLGDSCTLGRERGEINFPDDGYVSGLHARLTLRDGRVYLADLGSSNGTFIKVNGERAVGHDSFVLLGQQLFRLNFA